MGFQPMRTAWKAAPRLGCDSAALWMSTNNRERMADYFPTQKVLKMMSKTSSA